MKKYILSIFVAFAISFSFAQSNVIFYQENNRPFTLIINGIAQNISPKSNIKVTDIDVDILDVKIQFNNGRIAQRMIMSTQGLEITYKVKRNLDTGQPFIYFDKEVSIGRGLTYLNQFIIQYQDQIQNNNNHNNHHNHHNHHHNDHVNNNTNEVIIIEHDCLAMDNTSFNRAKNSVKSKSFSSSKMTAAKQVIQNNCLSVTQVKQMARLFTFEEDKLEFVKAAYHQTTNQHEYYLVNDIFTFSQSIENLDRYIKLQNK